MSTPAPAVRPTSAASPLPATLSVGLKEWNVVCDELASGGQILLLRKGGIHESGGKFELEHQRFALFPTFLHQNAEMLRSPWRDRVDKLHAEPESLRVPAWGEATDIIRVKSREQIDAVEDLHIWSELLIDMRFAYKPHNPLYLLVVRAHRLPQPQVIPNHAEYAGCHSWVPLRDEVGIANSTPAIADDEWGRRRAELLTRLGEAV
jgi:hypothetical protein